jgi:hypothetical protein
MRHRGHGGIPVAGGDLNRTARRPEGADHTGVGSEVVAGEYKDATPGHVSKLGKTESLQVAQQLGTDQEPSDFETWKRLWG